MSRGRKSGLKKVSFNWEDLFKRNVGNYQQLISVWSNHSTTQKQESTNELLKRIKPEKEELLIKRRLRPNNSNPKPEILKLRYNIPNGWNWFLLSDVAFYQEGPGIRSFQYRNEGVKLLNVENITEDELKLNLTTRYISRNEFESKYEHFKIEKGDILFASSGGSWGKSCLFEDPGYDLILNTSTMRIKTFSEKILLNSYLYIFLKSDFFKSQLSKQLMGMQPNFGSTHFNSISIPVPPLSEQLRILNFLETNRKNNSASGQVYFDNEVERKIIILHKNQLTVSEISNEFIFQKEFIKKFRQTILQEAVQGKLTKQSRLLLGKNDEPADKLLQRIKSERQKLIAAGKLKKEREQPPITEDEIPFELPKGWMWCRLGEAGITQTGATPPTNKKEYFGDYIPFIGPGDMNDGKMDYDNNGLSKLGVEKGRLIAKNSILMVCIGGSIGKALITDRDITCNQQINTIKGLGSIPVSYLFFALTSPFFQHELLSKATGSATPIINKGKWESIPIPIPPFSEQHRIVAKVEQLMQMINELEKQVEQSQTQAEQLLQAVLKEAFSNKGKEYPMDEVVTMGGDINMFDELKKYSNTGQNTKAYLVNFRDGIKGN